MRIFAEVGLINLLFLVKQLAFGFMKIIFVEEEVGLMTVVIDIDSKIPRI